MTITVITSFNDRYYTTIGKDCVDTWLKFWPEKTELICYVEEFSMPITDSRVSEISFDQLPREYFQFQNDPTLDSRVKIFAKKAYSIIHALENISSDRIMWLDADVITTKKLPLDIIESLCPNDTLLAYMRVWHHIDKHDINSQKVPSAESGVFVVNTKHPEFENFRKRYRQYYDERITDGLRRFYDGEVLGAVAKEFETRCKIIDLCAGLKKEYKSPLRHLLIGQFLIHYKAKHSKDEYGK